MRDAHQARPAGLGTVNTGYKHFLLALLASLLVHLAIAVGTPVFHSLSAEINQNDKMPRLDARLVTRRVESAPSSAQMRERPKPAPVHPLAAARIPHAVAQPKLAPADTPPASPQPQMEAETTAVLPSDQDETRVTETTDDRALPNQAIDPAATDDVLAAAAHTEPPSLTDPSSRIAEVDQTLNLPETGRVRYVVMRGEQGFVMGQSLHQWQHDKSHYQLESVTETTGLVALFRSLRAVWRSQGAIVNGNLQPQEFQAEKAGKRDGGARFDWSEKQLHLDNGQQLELLPQTQDVLSMFYQLSLMLPELLQAATISHQVDNNLGQTVVNDHEFELPVTTGRKLARYRFRLLGVEKLELMRHGQQDALHVRTLAHAGEQTIDIWLGLNTYGLPLKIRYTESNGLAYEQLATDIELSTPAGAGTSGNE